MIIVYFTLLHVQFKDWHIELKQFNVSMTTSNLTFERKGLRLLLLSTRYYKNIGSRNINILSFIYIRYQTINKRMKKFSATYRWYNKDDIIKVWFKIFLFFFFSRHFLAKERCWSVRALPVPRLVPPAERILHRVGCRWSQRVAEPCFAHRAKYQ